MPINFDNTKVAFAYKSKKQLRKSDFVFSTMSYPWMVKLGTRLTTKALDMGFPIKGIVKKTLFNQFCGGETIEGCGTIIRQLADFNVKTILDYSVEGQKSEDNYNDARDEALRVVDYASRSNSVPFCVIKLSAIGPAEAMTKAQDKETLTDLEKTKLHYCEQRAIGIAQLVAERGLMMMIDAEESWFQSYVDGVAYMLMERFNKERPVVFNTYQLYRHDVFDRLRLAIAKATNNGYYIGAKLVRGAYMEKERERAQELNYKSPIHQNKEGVDIDFNDALKLCIEQIQNVGICCGSHNEESIKYLVELMEEEGLSPGDPRVYFAQLLGMSDNISFMLAKKGYNVAKYVPYGPVEEVLPYLFRRAEENTSIAGQSGREHALIRQELKRRKVESE